jgi:hypothetical protein
MRAENLRTANWYYIVHMQSGLDISDKCTALPLFTTSFSVGMCPRESTHQTFRGSSRSRSVWPVLVRRSVTDKSFGNDASFDPLHEDEQVVSDYAVVSAGESRNPAYLIHWQVQDQRSSSNEMLKPSSFNVDMKIPDYIARV